MHITGTQNKRFGFKVSSLKMNFCPSNQGDKAGGFNTDTNIDFVWDGLYQAWIKSNSLKIDYTSNRKEY